MNEHDPDYERTWGICPVWDESDGGYDVPRRAGVDAVYGFLRTNGAPFELDAELVWQRRHV